MSYDVSLLTIQLYLWTYIWATTQVDDGSISVKTWAMVLPVYGIVTVAYYGKAGLRRAVYLVVSMQVVLWTGHWLGSSIRDKPPRWLGWAVLVCGPAIIAFGFCGLAVFDRLEQKRRPKNRD